jgi:phosphatidylserine/phosphatidylglycerophosphate/cardiolipin synthase-like enzyme
MGVLSTFELQILSALAGRASLASALFNAWRQMPLQTPVTPRLLTAAASLSIAEEHGSREVLETLTKNGAVCWAVSGYVASEILQQSMKTLVIALSAVDHFAERIHVDETYVDIVLTRPAHSSLLELQLANRGWKVEAIEATDQAFVGIVQGAREQVVIMSPFLDLSGAAWLKELVANVRAGVAIKVILRSLENASRADYPSGYDGIGEWLAKRGVSVFNYSIPKDSGSKRETFHAKVVLSDRDVAYVGSSNLTAASREFSMELGVVLRGKAARLVSEVVEAVLLSSDLVTSPIQGPSR